MVGEFIHAEYKHSLYVLLSFLNYFMTGSHPPVYKTSLYSLGKLLSRGARLVEKCYDRIEYLHTLALLLYRKTVKLELELDDQQLQLADQNDRHVHLLKKCEKLEVRFSSAILRLPVSGC